MFNRPALISRFHPAGNNHWSIRRGGIGAELAAELSAELWEQLSSANGDVILSCEYLYNLGAGVGKMMRSFIDLGFEPVFICYVRHPVDSATSTAQQEIKMGSTTHAAVVQKPRWHCARKALEPYLDAGANLIVRDYRRATTLGITQDLLCSIGYPDLAGMIERKDVNVSLTMDGVILADIFKRYVEEHQHEPFPRELIFKIGGSRFTLPEKTKNIVRKSSEKEVNWVAETFEIDLQESASDSHSRMRLSAEAVIKLLSLMRK